MDKDTAIGYLRSMILGRFPPGPARQRWLAWLTEFSHAEETLQILSVFLISQDDDEPPRAHYSNIRFARCANVIDISASRLRIHGAF